MEVRNVKGCRKTTISNEEATEALAGRRLRVERSADLGSVVTHGDSSQPCSTAGGDLLGILGDVLGFVQFQTDGATMLMPPMRLRVPERNNLGGEKFRPSGRC
jgi:hypothetical protein